MFERVKESLDGSKALAEETLNAGSSSSGSSTSGSNQPRCRAAEAVSHIEALMRINRNFMPSDNPKWDPHVTPAAFRDRDEARGGGLLQWLVLAHSRARRCRGQPQLAAIRTSANPERFYPPPGVHTHGKMLVRADVAPVIGNWKIG